jgi:dolichol-phosphate mannosyltransferase
MRHRHNWFQLLRFGLVGASGFVVNLGVFSLAYEVLNTDWWVAATVAFIVALTNNFIWNRIWTFGATSGHAGFQAARFCTVSLVAFFFGLGVLGLGVELFGKSATIAAQVVAIVLATPLNFIGNRLWSFRADRRSSRREVALD